MQGLADAFKATLRAVFADRAVLASTFLAVIIYSFYYPVAYRHQVATRIPVAVVDLDRSPSSRALLRKALAVRAIDLLPPVDSMWQARQQVEAGQADGILLIEAGFERDIRRGAQGRVAVQGAGAFLSRAATVLNGLAEAVRAFSTDVAREQARVEGPVARPALVLIERPLFNTREGYASNVVTGVSVLIVQQTLLLGMVLLLATRREQQGGQPLREGLLVLGGRMAAFWLLGMLNLLYYTGFVFWLQDFPRGGNLPGMLAGGALFISAVVCLGMLAGSFFRQRERAPQLILLLAMPLYFFSGLSWPQALMPGALACFGRLFPSTPGINLVIRLNHMDASLADVVPELLNLGLLVLVYGGLSAWRYRRRPAC